MTNVTIDKKPLAQIATEQREEIQLRIDVLDLVRKTINMWEVTEKENRGEVIANFTLAFRHLEDAKMRLGKVFQALDGGESVYDKLTK
jgi:hypothetical protein